MPEKLLKRYLSAPTPNAGKRHFLERAGHEKTVPTFFFDHAVKMIGHGINIKAKSGCAIRVAWREQVACGHAGILWFISIKNR